MVSCSEKPVCTAFLTFFLGGGEAKPRFGHLNGPSEGFPAMKKRLPTPLCSRKLHFFSDKMSFEKCSWLSSPTI